MKNRPSSFVFVVLCASLLASAAAGATPLRLWYERPATEWVQALPVGNGRLGAMVFGGIDLERIQLNEDTLWAGGPYNPANPDARAALPAIRALLAEGRHAEAQALVGETFMSVPLRQMPYQTIGDLLVSMPASETAFDYSRELDLDTAIARTQFVIGSVRYVREVYASPVDDVLIIRLEARHPNPDDGAAGCAFHWRSSRRCRRRAAAKAMTRSCWQAGTVRRTASTARSRSKRVSASCSTTASAAWRPPGSSSM